MPAKPFEVELKDNGKFKLAGLSERDFSLAMKQIERVKSKKRRNAKNTITPNLLRSKDREQIKRLNKKRGGEPYTRADLVALEANKKSHERKYNRTTAGITLSEIISQSLDIDVKRANNTVNDNSGIKRANLNAGKDNVFSYRVAASEKHGDDYHQVKIRFEEWDDYLHDADVAKPNAYKNATRKAAKGRISFDCTCGRHQFYYRYLATIGNYCVAPPKEFSPPKEKNPDFKGIACKHVLHVLNKVQAPSWVNQLSHFMSRQAKKVGGGSLRKQVISDAEAKRRKQVNKRKIDVQEYADEYKKYKARQLTLGKRITASNKEIALIRKNAARARKVATAEGKRADKAERALSRSAQLNKDVVRFGYDLFKDANASSGLSQKQIETGYASKAGISVKELKGFLNE